MQKKVRIELDPNMDDEIVIKCKELSPDVLRLQRFAESGDAVSGGEEICLELNGAEFFVKLRDILFFETEDNKTTAHTADKMYYTNLKLYELIEKLPFYFARVSKACIVNIKAVSSLKHDITGIGEASFEKSKKRVYISRMYYKTFRQKLEEIRLKRG